MKKLLFDYDMKITFDSPVSNHRFTVRCIPQNSERQRIRQLQYMIFPDSSLAAGFSTSTDSFGNYCVYGECSLPHERFEIHVQGMVESGLQSWETAASEHMLGRYRYATDYTRPGKNIYEFYRQFSFSPAMTVRDKSVRMMHQLYDRLAYVPGATQISTTAEEALALGKGVCQDYSHILISLCRLEGIPARYVVGMLMGEGASHAWVEIYDKNRWYALDPTNNLFVEDAHIKISHGRDYKDCLINQGVFTGTAKQTQEIHVLVEERDCQEDGEHD